MNSCMDEIRAAAAQVPGVRGVEKCFARKTGLRYHVDLHLEVDPEMTVRQSHEIAHNVLCALRRRSIGWPTCWCTWSRHGRRPYLPGTQPYSPQQRTPRFRVSTYVPKGEMTMSLRARVRGWLIAGSIMISVAAMSAVQAHAGILISVNIAPPALPVYVQPPLPAPGYIWTPGYWVYGDAGYFWVPGVWVMPPSAGLLWTPGYWGFAGGVYGWHPGYWGPHVGFYGGVNYGFGYGGIGFVGGEWRGGVFAYNSAVANFGSVHVTNVYVNRTIVTQNTIANVNHVSFNGAGGIQARASATEMQAANERHFEPTANQLQHQNFAAQDRSQLASVNHGRPRPWRPPISMRTTR